MKRSKKISTMAITAVLILSMIGIVPNAASSVSAASTTQKLNLEKKKSVTIKAPTMKGYTCKKVSTKVSKKGIISVKKQSKGKVKVTAKKKGKTNLTLTYTFKKGSKTKTKKVTYKLNIVSKSVAVKSVSLSDTDLTLTEGEEVILKATVKPSNATNGLITWSSSDSKVASVDAIGTLTAKSKGTATITAKTTNGKKATCKVTVKSNDVSVESITLDKTSLDLEVDETATLTATVKPDNATDKTVTWSSSNSLVASVDSNGVVTAQKAGTATITATAGGKSATAVVTVTAPAAGMTHIKWNAVPNATGYMMYRKIKGQADSSYKFLVTETNTWYTDNSTAAKKEYTYKIVPVISTLTESTKLDPLYVEATSVSYGIFHQTAAKEYLAYVNGVREQYNEEHKNDSDFVKREPLVWNESLEKSAMIRASELQTVNDHQRPSGTYQDIYMVDALECVGFTSNIILSDICEFDWDDSHRGVIYRTKYTQVGIGIYENGDGNLYMAIVFSYSDSQTSNQIVRASDDDSKYQNWMKYQKRETVWDGMVGTDGKDTVLKTQLGNYLID